MTKSRHIRRSVVSSYTYSGVPNSAARSAASQPPSSRRPDSFTSAVIGKRLWFANGMLASHRGELWLRRFITHSILGRAASEAALDTGAQTR